MQDITHDQTSCNTDDLLDRLTPIERERYRALLEADDARHRLNHARANGTMSDRRAAELLSWGCVEKLHSNTRSIVAPLLLALRLVSEDPAAREQVKAYLAQILAMDSLHSAQTELAEDIDELREQAEVLKAALLEIADRRGGSR